MDCLICYEKLNKSNHSPTTCASCASVFCRECVQAYLLQDENRDPICPNTECKKPWTQQFLYDTLTAKFRLGPYKAHREKILFDQQKARLPDTQEDARRYKDALEISKPIHTEIGEIRALIKTLPEVVKYKEEQKIYNDATRDKWRTLKREDYILWRDNELPAINVRHYDAQQKKRNAEEKYLKKMRRLYDTCREADFIVNHFGQPYPFLELEAGAGAASYATSQRRRTPSQTRYRRFRSHHRALARRHPRSLATDLGSRSVSVDVEHRAAAGGGAASARVALTGLLLGVVLVLHLVVVEQLLALANRSRRLDVDAPSIFHGLAVRRARVVDEARLVAAYGGVDDGVIVNGEEHHVWAV